MEWNCGNGITALFIIPKVFFTPLFRQCHYHSCKKFIPSISAMPLPQTIFFFLPFSAMALPQLPIFFFPNIWFSLCALTLRASTRAAGMGRRNCSNTIVENKKFLSSTFYLSLSDFCWISAMVLPQFTLFPQIAK